MRESQINFFNLSYSNSQKLFEFKQFKMITLKNCKASLTQHNDLGKIFRLCIS